VGPPSMDSYGTKEDAPGVRNWKQFQEVAGQRRVAVAIPVL